MAALDGGVYSPSEWRVAIKPETTVGTVNTTTMNLLNVDPGSLINHTTELVQTLDVRSGVGRTLKAADVFTTDKGGILHTIEIPIVMDTTIDTMLHEAAVWLATGASPASVDVAYDHAIASQAHGGSPSGNVAPFTVALINPITNKTILFPGCTLDILAVTMDRSVEAGRRHAVLTFRTRYRPGDGTTDPTSMTAYGATFRYLRELTPTKNIGGDGMVFNKVNYTITNPSVHIGHQGSNGEPEIIARSIPNIDVKVMVGVKFDANTREHWENRRDGDNIAIEISNNATWASATFGLKADLSKIINEVAPAGTDEGVFQDLELQCLADTSGDVIQIVP